MNVLINPDGTRNRDFRPYINEEETTRNMQLYNPHSGPHYGLYDGPLKSCNSFSSSVLQHQKKGFKPFAEISKKYGVVTLDSYTLKNK